MSEHDAMEEQVVAALFEVHTMGAMAVVGMKNKRTPTEYADKIIALVRADERKRIREALLSPYVAGMKAEQWRLADDASEFDEAVATLERQLSAIGITE